MRTRLDAVVQVRERAEEKALTTLGQAETKATLAADKAAQLRQASLTDHRAKNDVASWELVEVAHHRSLIDARRAQKDAEQAKLELVKVRSSYTVAHQQAEVVRRVAEARKTEQLADANRAEGKDLDEVAALLWFRKAG